MNSPDKRYHIGFWIIKIAIIFVFFHLPYKSINPTFWLGSPLTFIFHIGYFYGIYSFLFPRFFEKKQYFEFTLGVAFLTFLHSVGLLWIWSEFSNITEVDLRPHYAGFFGANFVFFAISFTWKYLDFVIRKEQTKFYINKELKSSELSFLKAQINPHFLFNILGCINGLALTNSPKTAFAIKNFDRLIKASVSMKGGEKIDFHQEIEFLTSYIKLQEMRYAVPVNIECPEIKKGQYLIEPLLILPLIENVFTHGDVSDEGFVSFKCTINNGILDISIRNMIKKSNDNFDIGNSIEKLRNRLEIIYPNKFELSNRQFPDNFISNLKLDLNE